MRTSVLILVVSFCFAQMAVASSRYISSSEGRHFISGAFGFLAPGANRVDGTINSQPATNAFSLSGLFGIGADYDYMLEKNLSVGGVTRYYNVSTTINNQNYANTLFVLGPDARAYLPMDNWVPYATAGLVFMAPSLTVGGQSMSVNSALGLMLSAGLLYQLNSSVQLGIETMRLTGMSNSINGNLIEDYMLKGRFALGN